MHSIRTMVQSEGFPCSRMLLPSQPFFWPRKYFVSCHGRRPLWLTSGTLDSPVGAISYTKHILKSQCYALLVMLRGMHSLSGMVQLVFPAVCWWPLLVRGSSLTLPYLLQLGFLVRCWWALLDRNFFCQKSQPYLIIHVAIGIPSTLLTTPVG